MKRYKIRPDAIVNSYTGEWIRDDVEESPSGEWARYSDVMDMLYDLSRVQLDTPKGKRFPFGGLMRFYNLPQEYKYLYYKDFDDMTEEELAIDYKAIPAAKLGPIK